MVAANGTGVATGETSSTAQRNGHVRIERADVVIVGGGPIGNLIAYQLARFGCSPWQVEKEGEERPIYGRATTLWPRTLELYDQLDLLDSLLDHGVLSQTGINYRDGKAAPGGLQFGHRLDRHGDTSHRYSLHLRQRLTERAIEAALVELNYPVHYHHEFESYEYNEQDPEGLPITCTLRDAEKDEVYQVKAKYLIGTDGGKSMVRKAAQIPFLGSSSGAEWIRMDALVKTDMPNPRALNSVLSADHGVVLWCPIDEGKTRIGYVFNKQLQEKYGASATVTPEIAVAEARKALAPFTVDFVKVDWCVKYGIGQRMASHFISNDRVILAGDACHTHSSGSAQGLNTGTHDAVNLAWKLALDLKGVSKPELLASYDTERRALVQTVIDNDVIVATLTSNQLPPKYAHRTESPREILTEFFDNAKTQAFTLGLGIAYPAPSLLNRGSTSYVAHVGAGERGPDVKLTRLATGESLRLHRVLPNKGLFHIVVFTGAPHRTVGTLTSLRQYLDTPATSFESRFVAKAWTWSTLVLGEGISYLEAMEGVRPFGRAYFDSTRQAHEVYGVDPARGGIVVFRPDGWIGTVVKMDDYEKLGDYFAEFLREKSGAAVKGVNGSA